MDIVHTISATVMVDTTTGRRFQTAMCGTDLGDFDDAVKAGHVVGNYVQPEQIRQRVTCPGCLARLND